MNIKKTPFKINKNLTKEIYEREFAAGNISPDDFSIIDDEFIPIIKKEDGTSYDELIVGIDVPMLDSNKKIPDIYIDSTVTDIVDTIITSGDGEKYLSDDGTYKTIQSGGLNEIPQATENNLGGIKAKKRTTETEEIVIDESTGKLYAPSHIDDVGTIVTVGGQNQSTWDADSKQDANLTILSKADLYIGSTNTMTTTAPSVTSTYLIKDGSGYGSPLIFTYNAPSDGSVQTNSNYVLAGILLFNNKGANYYNLKVVWKIRDIVLAQSEIRANLNKQTRSNIDLRLATQIQKNIPYTTTDVFSLEIQAFASAGNVSLETSSEYPTVLVRNGPFTLSTSDIIGIDKDGNVTNQASINEEFREKTNIITIDGDGGMCLFNNGEYKNLADTYTQISSIGQPNGIPPLNEESIIPNEYINHPVTGTFDHRALEYKTAPDQHPISSITGLTNELTRIEGKIDANEAAEQDQITLLQTNIQQAYVASIGLPMRGYTYGEYTYEDRLEIELIHKDGLIYKPLRSTTWTGTLNADWEQVYWTPDQIKTYVANSIEAVESGNFPLQMRPDSVGGYYNTIEEVPLTDNEHGYLVVILEDSAGGQAGLYIWSRTSEADPFEWRPFVSLPIIDQTSLQVTFKEQTKSLQETMVDLDAYITANVQQEATSRMQEIAPIREDVSALKANALTVAGSGVNTTVFRGTQEEFDTDPLKNDYFLAIIIEG